MKRTDLTIQALAVSAKRGDVTAASQLLLKLRPLIVTISTSFPVPGHETEDLISEGWIAVLDALKVYDEKRDPVAYLSACIRDHYTSLLRRELAVKRGGGKRPLQWGIGSETTACRPGSGLDGVNKNELDPAENNPELQVFPDYAGEIANRELLRRMEELGSEDEIRVALLAAGGATLAEIQNETGLSQWNVRSRLASLRRKLGRFYGDRHEHTGRRTARRVTAATPEAGVPERAATNAVRNRTSR